MTVLSRAQWHDVPRDGIAGYLDEVRAHFSKWATVATEKGDTNTFPDGKHAIPMDDRERTISLRRVTATDTAVMGFEGQAWDVTHDVNSTTRWTVVVRAVGNDEGVDVLVENRMESSDPSQPISIGRPRVISDLLSTAENPFAGSIRLLTEPQEIPSNAIDWFVSDVLRSAKRVLPAIVCTEPENGDPKWRNRADRIAKRTQGFAHVFLLDRSASTTFRSILNELAAWNGCVRVYSPGPLNGRGDRWRHKFFLLDPSHTSPMSVINRVVVNAATISSRMPTARALALFSPITSGTQQIDDDGHGLSIADDLEFQLLETTAEKEDCEHALARALGQLARLRSALEQERMPHLYWGTADPSTSEIPDDVQDIEEAVMAATLYLTEDLVISESAARDLDRLAAGPNAQSWGSTAWRGLRALAAYAHDQRTHGVNGGFWEWCASDQGLWPATDKKLSMTESPSVQNNAKFNDCRYLDVDPKVAPEGKIYMYAHLKIAEGGGGLAPRIYFHDDSRGVTGKVHIGFVGPHYLMPNTKTH